MPLSAVVFPRRQILNGDTSSCVSIIPNIAVIALLASGSAGEYFRRNV